MRDKAVYSKKEMESKWKEIAYKMVKATELSFSAKSMCEESNRMLFEVQTDILELHLLLNEKQSSGCVD